ncbi:MAG TPA: trypsin-like peptidase domain-containing protein [Chthoniobacter sp.]|nr:trypsin-like peptidase domain-containing protein [Chthoniobacter sp.]
MPLFLSPLRARLRSIALLIATLLCGVSPALRADLTQEQVIAAKAATGLLITPQGSGTAFCISESGLFVTCKHVVTGVKDDAVSIVLSPTGKDEKRYPAKVVRRMSNDLALVKVALDRKVPVLKLGNIDGLFETQQLYAFGYPFGNALAEDAKSYPSISVNVGRISALRKKKDVLDVIQFDAQVNPGNSGGPVLDPNGNVVGIVESGVVASGINFAVPVSQLSNEMAAPIISVNAPKLDAQHPNQPIDFTVSVDWFAAPAEEPKVMVEVLVESLPHRIDAAKEKDGLFHAKYTPPTPPPVKTEKSKLQISLDFASGKMAGTIDDGEVGVGGKPKALREIHTLQRTPNSDDFLADGQPAGKLEELKALALDMGGATVTVDARKASRIDIKAPEPAAAPAPGPITYKAVVALVGGREFTSEEKRVGTVAATTNTAPVLGGHVDLSGAREIALPSPFSDVVAAQDGRSLLFYMKEAKQIAVFDVLSLKIRGYIPVGDDNAKIAGGAKYVLAVCPGNNVIERFSLETLQRDRTIANPFGDVMSITMGRSSPGLALVIASASPPVINAFDAESMTVTFTGERSLNVNLHASLPVVRASADGRTFGIQKQGISPSGFIILNYRDGEFALTYERATCGVLVPNADGSQIFTSDSGIFTNKYVSILKGSNSWARGVTYIPSYHPMYFIGVPYEHDSGDRKKKNNANAVSIYWSGASQPLVQAPEEFPEMQPTKQEANRTNDPITRDKRYHFFPQFNLLLTIPLANNRIVVRSFDVHQLLEEKGIDYLYVTSFAPLGKAGAPYHYKLEADSKAGGVSFTLQSGPTGLTVSKEGEVAWTPPAKPADETVIVSLKDTSGQEQIYSFHVVTTP